MAKIFPSAAALTLLCLCCTNATAEFADTQACRASIDSSSGSVFTVWVPSQLESESYQQNVLRISLSTEDHELGLDVGDGEFERLISEVEILKLARLAYQPASKGVYGVARCRPSAESSKFLCPGVYFNGEQGESGFQLYHEELVAQFPNVTVEVVLNAFEDFSQCRLTSR